jgi:hypothetical protein
MHLLLLFKRRGSLPEIQYNHLAIGTGFDVSGTLDAGPLDFTPMDVAAVCGDFVVVEFFPNVVDVSLRSSPRASVKFFKTNFFDIASSARVSAAAEFSGADSFNLRAGSRPSARLFFLPADTSKTMDLFAANRAIGRIVFAVVGEQEPVVSSDVDYEILYLDFII